MVLTCVLDSVVDTPSRSTHANRAKQKSVNCMSIEGQKADTDRGFRSTARSSTLVLSSFFSSVDKCASRGATGRNRTISQSPNLRVSRQKIRPPAREASRSIVVRRSRPVQQWSEDLGLVVSLIIFFFFTSKRREGVFANWKASPSKAAPRPPLIGGFAPDLARSSY